MKRAMAVVIVLAAPAAWADQVYLRGGGVLSGEVVEQTAAAVVIEVGPGRMTLPAASVLRVAHSQSALAVFRQRAAGLGPDNPAGWLELARFAESRDLLTQAREAYEQALSADPGNAVANAALGRQLVDGRWLDREDAYRAHGLVPFDGQWVTPAERAALIAERAAEQRSRELALEASARAREAEARARTAEAEARRAEAAVQENGIPYGYGDVGYGGIYGGGVYGGGVRSRRGPVHPYAQTSYGFGGPYAGVYGADGLRHAGSPGAGFGGRPVVAPHAPPMRDTGGSGGSRRH
jgi:hypothetical protein